MEAFDTMIPVLFSRGTFLITESISFLQLTLFLDKVELRSWNPTMTSPTLSFHPPVSSI